MKNTRTNEETAKMAVMNICGKEISMADLDEATLLAVQDEISRLDREEQEEVWPEQ